MIFNRKIELIVIIFFYRLNYIILFFRDQIGVYIYFLRSNYYFSFKFVIKSNLRKKSKEMFVHILKSIEILIVKI